MAWRCHQPTDRSGANLLPLPARPYKGACLLAVVGSEGWTALWSLERHCSVSHGRVATDLLLTVVVDSIPQR